MSNWKCRIAIGFLAAMAAALAFPALAQPEGRGAHEHMAVQAAETPTTETAAGAAALTEEAEPAEDLKMQETCPIMGGKIDKKYFIDVEGRRIYGCCAMCLDKIKEDPKKALDTLKERGEKAELLPEETEKGDEAAGEQPAPSPVPSEPEAEKKS